MCLSTEPGYAKLNPLIMDGWYYQIWFLYRLDWKENVIKQEN